MGYEWNVMLDSKNTKKRLLILTDLGRVRVLAFTEAGDDPRERAHLKELTEAEMVAPIGSRTTDEPGKFSRGYAAGSGEALSQVETKLDVEVEKRAIGQVASEICDLVERQGCEDFILAAPQEHLKRLKAEMSDACRGWMRDSVGADLVKEPLKDLEGRFL